MKTKTIPQTIGTLDQLLTALRDLGPAPTGRDDDETDAEYADRAERLGLPVRGTGVMWEALPLFGGEVPSDTRGIWSWDPTRLLVGEGYDWRLVERTEECAYCGAEPPVAPVPEVDDDATWAALARQHAPDCEWIATRAHRIASDD